MLEIQRKILLKISAKIQVIGFINPALSPVDFYIVYTLTILNFLNGVLMDSLIYSLHSF